MPTHHPNWIATSTATRHGGTHQGNRLLRATAAHTHQEFTTRALTSPSFGLRIKSNGTTTNVTYERIRGNCLDQLTKVIEHPDIIYEFFPTLGCDVLTESCRLIFSAVLLVYHPLGPVNGR